MIAWVTHRVTSTGIGDQPAHTDWPGGWVKGHQPCNEPRCRGCVEVGVHRGLSAGGVFDTVDFDPSASNPGSTAISVESII